MAQSILNEAKADMGRKSRLTILMPPHVKQECNLIAAVRGRSMSSIVVEAVNQWMDNQALSEREEALKNTLASSLRGPETD